MSEEDRYESIDIIIKARSDGQSWFDIISDLISEECTGILPEDFDPDDPENYDEDGNVLYASCTCGLESMGGTTGTLDQCYRHSGIADDLVGPVDKTDLMAVLSYINQCPDPPSVVWQAYKKLWKECTWWDETLERWANEEELDQDYPGGDEGDCRGIAN